MKKKLIRIGNSQALTIPKAFIELLDLNKENEVIIEFKNGKLLIKGTK